MHYILFAFLVLGHLAFADGISLKAPLDFDQIEKLLKDRRDVGTVEAFLHELPRENREHYVLMHTSASLQGASFEEPRVLSVTIDGNFALAFNGSHRQARGNTVEMWKVDRTGHRYEFREI